MNYGFVKIAAAVPKIAVADCTNNAKEIAALANEATAEGAEIILFPELSITSKSCGDLFVQQRLTKSAEKTIAYIKELTKESDAIVVVGAPVATPTSLLNCAVVMHRGSIKGIVAKSTLPYSDARHFASADEVADGTTIELCGEKVAIYKQHIFATPRYTFAIGFGEELYTPLSATDALALAGADIILYLAGDAEVATKAEKRTTAIRTQSRRTISALVYAGSGYGESTGDAVYAGATCIAECGEILKEGERFLMRSNYIASEIDVEKIRHRRRTNDLFAASRRKATIEVHTTAIGQQEGKAIALSRRYPTLPFVPKEGFSERCNEIFAMQVQGIAKRIEHTHAKSCVIGISGGLDSTLALLVTVRAFDLLGKERSGIVAVTMPGFGTTDRTYNNAIELMKSLGVTIREISIRDACIQHFKDIQHDANVHDVTFENAQARERTQILMDIANQTNGLVVGTGDLSELALGWATYNGDQMSMYGVNASVPKTLIRPLVRWIAENVVGKEAYDTLADIIDTPISPELTPADEQGNIKQKTEDLVGPYELHDFFLYHTLRNGFTPEKILFIARHTFDEKYDEATVKHWIATFFRRFFTQQFKRSCMPDGPQVGSCALSPRGAYQMPTDACWSEWKIE